MRNRTQAELCRLSKQNSKRVKKPTTHVFKYVKWRMCCWCSSAFCSCVFAIVAQDILFSGKNNGRMKLILFVCVSRLGSSLLFSRQVYLVFCFLSTFRLPRSINRHRVKRVLIECRRLCSIVLKLFSLCLSIMLIHEFFFAYMETFHTYTIVALIGRLPCVGCIYNEYVQRSLLYKHTRCRV